MASSFAWSNPSAAGSPLAHVAPGKTTDGAVVVGAADEPPDPPPDPPPEQAATAATAATSAAARTRVGRDVRIGSTSRRAQRSLATFSASSASGPVVRNASSISSASEGDVSLSPSASTLASFHRRAPAAVAASVHSAARTPGTLLAAIDTPVPVQQHTTPAATSPPATA